jgi:hypothetical protein
MGGFENLGADPTTAQLLEPTGIAIDGSGVIYFSDR